MRMRSCREFFPLALLAGFVTAIGCSVGTQGAENVGRQLPFTDSKPLVVPANTIIYVRLRQSVTSATAQTGQSFAAVLDQPLQVDNQTVAPQGAEISGKVLAARESGRMHTAGYVRITLSSITLNGKTLAMQTNSAIAGGSSLRNRNLGIAFVKGGAGGAPSSSFQASDPSAASGKKEAGFAVDSRIGFRLTQPLTIS